MVRSIAPSSEAAFHGNGPVPDSIDRFFDVKLDDFCIANDPHGEHDFGAFDYDGVEVFFKIDYFDKDLNFHSPDPANPAVTERVITLMLATEY